jgi:Bacterial protein of unknown function (DUF839)
VDPSHSKRTRMSRAAAATALLAAVTLAAPTGALADPGYNTSAPDYVALQPGIGGDVVPLINSGESVFGDIFEGIPDGIGVKPAPGRQGYIDLYVTHEQSHVPFGGFGDFQDSSVSRVRVDVASKSITDLEVVVSPDLGLIRFCSAFMAGPDQGFAKYTFFMNEESNDLLEVPAGAPYGSDPSLDPLRQAGYAAYLDTATGKVGVIASAGRHNHENMVIVPGWKKGIVALSGDDTFTFPSSPARPNLSQLYQSQALNANHLIKDDTTLWAFRVTGTGAGPVDPDDPFNDANDYFEISPGMTWTGEFIPVPADIAAGTTGDRPQDALEDWSNANNAFQFIRVEDIAYDPDSPRVVYFADTGNSRLVEDPGTGRLYRAAAGGSSSNGRIFKIVMNANDPTKVDAFSIVVDAASIGMRSPDNIDVGHHSLMVQEDTSNAKIWRQDLGSGTWTHVATATQPSAETSGIADVSRWFGDGWWAVTVQSHVNLPGATGPFIWDGPPGPAVGTEYFQRREDGQLLLLHVEGS